MTGVLQEAVVPRVDGASTIRFVYIVALELEVDRISWKGGVTRIISSIYVQDTDNPLWVGVRDGLSCAAQLGEVVQQVPRKGSWPVRQLLFLVVKKTLAGACSG